MPNKMERFTQRAREALRLAQEEAERLQHNTIGTEHLLLGLIREEGGVAGQVLRELGLEWERTEELVERRTRPTARSPNAKIDLSPGTMRVLELAVDEARRMGHHYIGTEHLLLGLIRQTEGVAIDILKRLGISPEEIRKQIRQTLQKSPVQPSPSPPSPSPSSPTPEAMDALWENMRSEISLRLLPRLLTQFVQPAMPERREEVQAMAEKVLLEILSESQITISTSERTRLIEQILAPLNPDKDEPPEPEVKE